MEHVGKMIHRQGHSTEAVTSHVQSSLTVEYPKISGEEKMYFNCKYKKYMYTTMDKSRIENKTIY